jgi:hypothetical protein
MRKSPPGVARTAVLHDDTLLAVIRQMMPLADPLTQCSGSSCRSTHAG